MIKKRKVGGVIIMRPNHNNYGTALQGLATVRVIQRLGYPFRIIRYRKRRTMVELLRTLPGYVMSGALKQWWLGRKRKRAKQDHAEYAKNVAVRTAKCNAFKERMFEPLCDYYIGWKDLSEGSKNYDVVFVGSDQVWSPLSLYAGFYNLLFVDEAIPQFSYASSFGKSNIMEHQKKGVARFLNKMDAIGVREVRGSEIVKELTGRTAQVVADPTLLLTKEEWEREIENSKAENVEPYILCYMLGPRKENRDAVTDLGRKLGLKVMTFNHMDWYEPTDEGFGDIPNYDSDCLDFIKLIRNAEFVVTDSFHCSVFSLIFHKKFLTFYRLKPTEKMSSHSRIEGLLQMAGMEERAVKLMGEDVDLPGKIIADVRWEGVDKRLEKLRKESMAFLEQCLEMKKGERGQ